MVIYEGNYENNLLVIFVYQLFCFTVYVAYYLNYLQQLAIINYTMYVGNNIL